MDLREDRFDFAEGVREKDSFVAVVVDNVVTPCPLVLYSSSVSHSVMSVSMASKVGREQSFEESHPEPLISQGCLHQPALWSDAACHWGFGARQCARPYTCTEECS